MKKYFLIILLSFSLSPCFGQEVNAREDRLFELVNNFSTAYLFNTYGLIGSIADGYDKDAYDESTVSDLLNAQKKLAGDLVALLE